MGKHEVREIEKPQVTPGTILLRVEACLRQAGLWRVRLDDLITHTVPLESIGQAFVGWEQHRGLKTVVHPQRS